MIEYNSFFTANQSRAYAVFHRPSGHSEIILRWHLKRLCCALMSTTLPSINSFSFVILTFFPSSKACFRDNWEC